MAEEAQEKPSSPHHTTTVTVGSDCLGCFSAPNANPSSQQDENNNNPKKVSKYHKEYKGIKRYAGIILILISTILQCLVNIMAKKLPDYGIDSFDTTFYRCASFATTGVVLYIASQCANLTFKRGSNAPQKPQVSILANVWPPHEGEKWKIWVALLLRGFIAAAEAIFRYMSYTHLSVGDTSVISSCSPILVTFIAHFWLGETCGLIPIIVSFTTVLGITLICRPPLITGQPSYDMGTLIGVAFAIVSMICSAFRIVITRKVREVHFILMLIVFGSCGVILALALAWTFGTDGLGYPTRMEDSLLVTGVGVTSSLAQIAFILAVKFEQAGPVALVKCSDVVFAFLLQFIFYGVIPQCSSGVGAIIVFVGILIMVSRKWIVTFPEDSKVRKYLNWVLC